MKQKNIKIIQIIQVDFDNKKSIIKAEKQQTQLYNKNYKLFKTTQIGLNKFKLYWIKIK